MIKKTDRNAHTGNVLDYVLWRGDITFAHDPWHRIDSLIAALISYANFGENELVFGSGREITIAGAVEDGVLGRFAQAGAGADVANRSELIEEMARSDRFASVRILDQVNDVDSERNIQFSAVTLEVPDTGTVIAYRGTDPSLVGWKEDFMMSYMTPVPAQSAAVAYLKKAAERTEGPLILTGHSKGGNIALYAAAHTAPEIRSRIREVCSFDGPGLDDATMASEGYRQITPLIRSVIPSDSIIGRLMNYHPVYRVVTSTKPSILQHDPFSWNLIGKRFDEREDITAHAQLMDKTLHEWIKSCSPEQRERFVTMIFGFLTKCKENAAPDKAVSEAEKWLDEDSRQMALSLIYRLMALQIGNVYDARVRQPLIRAAASLRRKKEQEKDPVVRSVPVEITNAGGGWEEAIEQARLMAEFNGLGRRESLRLRLFAEEMLSMARAVTGELKAVFRIECVGDSFVLRLTARTVMDSKKRRALLASSASGRNEASVSFLRRLKDAFEQALAGGAERVFIDLGAKERGASSAGEWDRCEQSVLLRLADQVKIGISGDSVSLTVSKRFDHDEDISK